MLLLGAAPLSACESEDECVQVSTSCAPLYAPTFANVYARTLAPSCATGGSSCHGPAGGRGGLVLADETSAYAALLDGGRVIPSDPGCSELIARVTSTDPDRQMPPGSALSEAERCAIVQWIANGAMP